VVESQARGDTLTTALIAVAAACIVTFAHEAIGHGTACLILDGRITLVTSVLFACTVKTGAVAAGGPIGDLVGAALAWLVLQFVPRANLRLALLLLLVTGFGVFWEAGYLFKAMSFADGDSYFAALGAFGKPDWWWRIGGFATGVLLYGIGIRATATSARRFCFSPDVFRTCWLAATLSAVLAAAFYSPARLFAMGQAALEIGAASWPLLLMSRQLPLQQLTGAAPIARNVGWIAGAGLFYILFVATLGRGMP